jgi:hypothetical protein
MSDINLFKKYNNKIFNKYIDLISNISRIINLGIDVEIIINDKLPIKDIVKSIILSIIQYKNKIISDKILYNYNINDNIIINIKESKLTIKKINDNNNINTYINDEELYRVIFTDTDIKYDNPIYKIKNIITNNESSSDYNYSDIDQRILNIIKEYDPLYN